MSVVAIVQARLGSSRFPGKVLQPVAGQPMLLQQLARIARSRLVERIVVATTDQAGDDAIVSVAAAAGYMTYRGSEHDVLQRVTRAGAHAGADHVVRLTADCPLTDPALIDLVVAEHLAGDATYTSNVMPPSWPDGLDVEVITQAALQTLDATVTDPAEREHVTLHLRKIPVAKATRNLRLGTDLSHLRWTVDEPADYELVCRLYDHLLVDRPLFDWRDVLDTLSDHPEWGSLNAHLPRDTALAGQLER